MEFDKNLLWVNDPYVIPDTPERRAAVKRGLFAYFKSSGTTPEAAYPRPVDAADRAAYAAFLSEGGTQ